MSDSVRPHRQQLTRLPCPWDSPGKNTGVGCHFLLQCMKVKSESEVAQSCPTLSDPMDCGPPGSSSHGIFQARVLEWGAIAFSTTCLARAKQVDLTALLHFQFLCNARLPTSLPLIHPPTPRLYFLIRFHLLEKLWLHTPSELVILSPLLPGLCTTGNSH